MRVASHRIGTLFACSVLAAGTATAQPAPGDVRPEDARGWEERPRESHIPVLGAIGRGIRRGAGFLVDVIAAPFRGTAYLEDRYHAISRTRDFFYNADHTAGVVPTVHVESGFGIMFGARAFDDDLFGNHEQVSVRGAYGGSERHSAQAGFALPRLEDGTLYVDAVGRYDVRDDLLFAGVGNTTAGDTRYGERRWLGTARTGLQHETDLVRVRGGARYIYNDRTFDDDVPSSIAGAYDTTTLVGFMNGVRLHELSGELELDLLDRTAGYGIRIAGFGGREVGNDTPAFSHWGGEVVAHVSPWREGRVLIARVAQEGVSRADVPFTELPRLGGSELLRGYSRDQFRDRLSVIGTLEYRYPVHRVVDGSLFVETGKVARSFDGLASTADWHVGYGGGLVVHSKHAPILMLQLAYGDGFQLLATTDVMQAFHDRGREL